MEKKKKNGQKTALEDKINLKQYVNVQLVINSSLVLIILQLD